MSTRKAKRLDLYCWKCHKEDTNFVCSGCQRSFHSKCLTISKNLKDLSPNWKCFECTNTSDNTAIVLDPMELQEMLFMSFKSISKSADYYFKSNVCFTDSRVKVRSNLIVNPINLNVIKEKINAFEYKTFRQMVADFRLILHNCKIGEMEAELIGNAKFLLSKAKQEHKDFEECVHCFINYYKTCKTQYYSWFSKPCKQMHPLVWARVRGHPYWPSKVIKAIHENSQVYVRFFGTHQTSLVKETDCYLISKENPNKTMNTIHKSQAKLMDAAIEELKCCMKYLKEEYPNKFSYSPLSTPFFIKNFPELNTNKPKNNFNFQNSCNDSRFPNRPIGWKPKARKSFPTPKNSQSSQLNQNIVVIEFNSKSLESIKREITDCSEGNNKRQKTEDKHNLESKMNSGIEAKNFEYMSQQNDLKVVELESLSTDSVLKSKPEIEINREVVANKQIECKTDIISNESVFWKQRFDDMYERVKQLEKIIEFNNNDHRKEILELKQKSDLALEQMKDKLQTDKQKALIEERNKQIAIFSSKVSELSKNYGIKRQQLIDKHKLNIKYMQDNFNKRLAEAKKQIWCHNCLNEAGLYCCNHTYYCSNNCQLAHWDDHKLICTQNI